MSRTYVLKYMNGTRCHLVKANDVYTAFGILLHTNASGHGEIVVINSGTHDEMMRLYG